MDCLLETCDAMATERNLYMVDMINVLAFDD